MTRHWYHIRSEWIGNLILTAAMLLFLSLYGCTSMLIGNAIGQGENLTPEQIDAYNKVGGKVFSCFTIKGPPPAGASVTIVVPKDSNFMPRFGDNCQVIQ